MVTVVGSLNMDLFIETPHLPAPGETVFGNNFRRSPGGKGANQAFALARLGTPCAMLGAVGTDIFGDEMLANLGDAGVDVTRVKRCPDLASGSAMIVVDAAGQNQIVVAPGANASINTLTLREHTDLFRRSRAVVVQLETPLDVVAEALRLARDSGALTVLNPAPFVPGCDVLLPLCDWVIPNEHEAARLTGIEVKSVESARAAAQRLRQRHPSLQVVLTLGANGAWLESAARSAHVPALEVKAIDTVGAGDTFVGALVSRLVSGAGPLDAVEFACAAAALAVTRRGAQAGIPTGREVESFLAGRA